MRPIRITSENYRTWIRWTGYAHWLVGTGVFTVVYVGILQASPKARLIHWMFIAFLGVCEVVLWWPLTRQWLREPHERLQVCIAEGEPRSSDDPFARQMVKAYAWALVRSMVLVWAIYYLLGFIPISLLFVWAGETWNTVLIGGSSYMTCMAIFIVSRLFYMGVIVNQVLDPFVAEERFPYRFHITYRIRLFVAACLIGTISVALFVLYAMYFIGFNYRTLVLYAYLPIPVSLAFTAIVGLYIWRRTRPIEAFLKANDARPGAAPLPLAEKAFLAATTFPNRANFVWIAMWTVVGSLILYLQISWAQVPSTDATVLLAGMFITSLGVCVYQMNWFRRIFRAFLRHISANYPSLDVEGLQGSTSVRGKLLLTFVGLIVFALTFAYVTTYQQHLAVLRSQYGREAARWVDVSAHKFGSLTRYDSPVALQAALAELEAGRAGYLIVESPSGYQTLEPGRTPLREEEMKELAALPPDARVWDLRSTRRTVSWRTLPDGARLFAVLPWDQELFTIVGFVPNIFFFVGLLLVALGSVVYSANEFSTPLVELTASAQAISQGKLGDPVPFGEPDEIGNLAHQFERMRRSLRGKIADLESANAEIRRTQQQLLARERLATIGQMASGIAHEIRNPLSSVKMNLQILEKKIGREGPESKHFHIAIDEVERLDRIVGDLLLYAKPLSLKQDLVSARQLFERVRHAAAPVLQTRRVSLEEAVEPEGLTFTADGERLHQVLLNLLLNAAQASGEGKAVRLRASASNGEIRLVVEDEGGGIAAEDLERIYDPFYTTKVDGTGLGLANARKIVRAHGGEIRAQSTPGQGAAFTITLPSEPA